MKTRYNFHLDADVLALLKALAYVNHTTVSDLIRTAVDNLLAHDRPKPADDHPATQ